MREWKRDFTIQHLLLIVAAATLMVVHYGLILPYAYELWYREMGL